MMDMHLSNYGLYVPLMFHKIIEKHAHIHCPLQKTTSNPS